MGEWANYKITLANKSDNLGQILMDKGLATREPNAEVDDVLKILVSVDKLKELGLYKEELDADYPGYEFVRMVDNSLCYFTKWAPNDRTVNIVSKLLPDEIFKTERSFSAPWYPSLIWYEQNGNDCLIDGTPVKNAIYELNRRLLQDREDSFRISLPIGNDDNKWGTFVLPKQNVTYFERNSYIYNISLFFDTDTIPVRFGNETIQMNTQDLVEAYYDSKNQYREKMRRNVEIEGLPGENFKQMGNENNSYYIVKIPCMENLSASGVLSVTVANHDANVEEGRATLGIASKERSARVMNQDGTIATKRILHSAIEESYLAAVEAGRVNASAELDAENEADVDLD